MLCWSQSTRSGGEYSPGDFKKALFHLFLSPAEAIGSEHLHLVVPPPAPTLRMEIVSRLCHRHRRRRGEKNHERVRVLGGGDIVRCSKEVCVTAGFTVPGTTDVAMLIPAPSKASGSKEGATWLCDAWEKSQH